jgi:hypothetical protein
MLRRTTGLLFVGVTRLLLNTNNRHEDNKNFFDSIIKDKQVDYVKWFGQAICISEQCVLHMQPELACMAICNAAQFLYTLKKNNYWAFSQLNQTKNLSNYLVYWQTMKVDLNAEQLIQMIKACSRINISLASIMEMNLPKLLPQYALKDLAVILNYYASIKSNASIKPIAPPPILFDAILSNAKAMTWSKNEEEQTTVMSLVVSYNLLKQKMPEVLWDKVAEFARQLRVDDLGLVMQIHNKYKGETSESLRQVLHEMSKKYFVTQVDYKELEKIDYKQIFQLLKSPGIDLYSWMALMQKRMPFPQDNFYDICLSRAVCSLAAATEKLDEVERNKFNASNELKAYLTQLEKHDFTKMVNEFSISSIFWGYSKLKHQLPKVVLQQIHQVLLTIFTNKLSTISASSLSAIIWSCAKANRSLPENALAKLQEVATQLTDKEAENITWACFKLKQELPEALATKIEKKKTAGTMNVRETFMLLNNPKIDLYAWMASMQNFMPFPKDDFYNICLTRSVHSLAVAADTFSKANVSNRRFLETFCASGALKAYLNKWEQHNFSDIVDEHAISSILRGYAKLGQQFPKVILPQIHWVLSTMTADNFSTIVWAHAKINLPLPEDILTELEQRIAEQLNARQTANVTWACLKLGQELPSKVVEQVKKLASEMRVQEISMVWWAHGYRSKQAPIEVFNQLSRVITLAKPQEIANIMFASAKLSVPFHELPPALIAQIEQFKNDFKLQELIDVVWALDSYFALNPANTDLATQIAYMREKIQTLEASANTLKTPGLRTN